MIFAAMMVGVGTGLIAMAVALVSGFGILPAAGLYCLVGLAGTLSICALSAFRHGTAAPLASVAKHPI